MGYPAQAQWNRGDFLTRNAAVDMRRHVSPELRTRVRDALPWLPESDRVLLKHVLELGHSAASVAALQGKRARQVRARVRKLITRVNQPEFRVALLLQTRGTGMRKRVAEACFLHGLSMRRAAQHLALSQHQVRQHAAAIRNQAEALAMTMSSVEQALRSDARVG